MKWYWKLFMFVGLLLAYLKTAEAMVQFSPKEFLGFSDPSLPYLWGYIAAGMVEGLALFAFENLIKVTRDTPTRTVSAILVGATVIFSIAMNLIDQAINDHTFTGGAGTPTGALLYQVMGLIPIITAILLGTLRIVDAYFPDKQNQGGNKGGSQQNSQQYNRPYQDVTVQNRGNAQQAQGKLPQPQGRPQLPPTGASRIPNLANADPFRDLMEVRKSGNGHAAFGNDVERGPRLVDPVDPTPPA